MRIEFIIGNWLMGNYHGNLELGSRIAVKGIGVRELGSGSIFSLRVLR
jgi:hypothetical protein